MKTNLKYLAAACMIMGASNTFAAAAATVCITTDTTDPVTSVVTSAALNTVNTCVPEVTMYIAGASALGNAITTVAPADLFDSTLPITKVKADTTVPNATATSAWLGTAKASTGTAAGKRLYVVYNNQNGSSAGISQLLSPIKDTTISESQVVTVGPISKVAGIVAVTQAASVGGKNTCTQQADTTVGTVTYQNVTCTTFNRVQADLGISDVRPDMLYAFTGAKPKKLSTLTYFPISMQGFAVGVNANLYNALQTQQIADGSLPSSCTAGDLTAACQPSVRKADYASLSSTQGGIKSAAALLNNPLDTTLLTLSRRDDLSGTQASSAIFFGDNPCGVSVDSKGKVIKGVIGGALSILGSPTPIVPSTTVYTVASPTAVVTPGIFQYNAQATSGGVKADLASATGYVIGVVSLDSAEPTRTATSYKYVKIDGQSPNFKADGTIDADQRLAMINGNYPFVVASYAATAIKPLNKTSVVVTHPTLVSEMITGLKDSTLHNLRGIGYLDGATDAIGGPKQAKYIRTGGNSCSPLIKG